MWIPETAFKQWLLSEPPAQTADRQLDLQLVISIIHLGDRSKRSDLGHNRRLWRANRKARWESSRVLILWAVIMLTKLEDLQTPKPHKNVSKRTAGSRDLGIQSSAPLVTGPISSLRLRKERQVGLRGSNRVNQVSGGSLIIAGPRENHHLTKLLIHHKVITCIIQRKQQICLRRMDSKIKLSRITTFHLLNNQCNSTSEVNRT